MWSFQRYTSVHLCPFGTYRRDVKCIQIELLTQSFLNHYLKTQLTPTLIQIKHILNDETRYLKFPTNFLSISPNASLTKLTLYFTAIRYKFN